ncbi:glycosyltransferase family 4 protein [Ferruginibacter albus]|uniref:glycosyltransferase family 4 protein n=1 Tax=Ferruginibacter albus TaxID=2875540 RepID=UPI001CC6AAE9|nr:glycosyltransferase [Ferruginibacter albus]UAY52244.1 glycosyltransferase [Ferruginibacter albus]
MNYYSFLCFGVSLIMSMLIQVIFIRLSHKRGIFIDHHESDLPQKFHKNPTPRVGGVGVFIACWIFCFVGKTGFLLLFCALPAFLAGLFEDIYLNFSPNKRLLIMFASGILPAILLNTVVTNFGLFTLNYSSGVFISFIAIIGLINGANMIDGFNGLLSGTAIIIFGSFAYMCHRFFDGELFIINVVIVAAIIGFIFFNYPKGKIFLGDGGAYILGFFMAVMAMLISCRHTQISPFFVLVCIAYPVMEVIFSFIRKGIIENSSPFHPDSNHLHMLINRGVVKGKNSQTVFVILPVVFFFNIAAICFYNNQTALILFVLLFVIIYLMCYAFLSKAKEN